MKKLTSTVLMSLCFSLIVGSAEARNTKRPVTSSNGIPLTSERIETHQAAAEHHSNGIAFSLGLSSISPLPMLTTNGVAGGASLGSSGSLTAILQFTNLDAVQILAGIPSTIGSFSFGVGGLYKRTIFGGENAGMHVGIGFGVGALQGDFAMSIPALAGVHYTLSGTGVSFQLDGGAAFCLVHASAAGVSSTATNFSMGPLSNLLGATVVYNL